MAVSHIFSSPASNFTGTITGFDSRGSTATIAATDLIRPQDWNSVHNQYYTLSGNTTGNSTASGTNVVFQASNNLTIAGSTGTIVFVGQPHISSYENFAPLASHVMRALGGASVSDAVGFQLPQPLSASFLRLAVQMTTNSTTLATTAATMNASVEFRSTWNAVVYSLGTGASSASLISVASGQALFTQQNSISVAANGTQYSVTQAYSGNANGGGTTLTTQYSISNTNYSFTTNKIATLFSGNRYIDIPFTNSLSAGAYWLIFGYSSSTTANSTGVSAASNCNVRYSAHFNASQPNSVIGVMGSTDLTSGGNYNAGSFSTAGGGTTSALPYSAISSQASNARAYFQLLRSA